MFISVQAEGMGGATIAYPLDALSAYHQPAIRSALGSRIDLEGGKDFLGFGYNEALCSWIAGGISVSQKIWEGGLSFSLLSQAFGVSLHRKGYTFGWWGEWGWRASWGVTYSSDRHFNLGLALHPHKAWTIATEIGRIGMEWRAHPKLALRTGYALVDLFSFGATYYPNFTHEISLFVNTKVEFGVELSLKW